MLPIRPLAALLALAAVAAAAAAWRSPVAGDEPPATPASREQLEKPVPPTPSPETTAKLETATFALG